MTSNTDITLKESLSLLGSSQAYAPQEAVRSLVLIVHVLHFQNCTWRYRTATNVVDELEMLYKQGYRECVFIDDNFTQNEERVIDICDQIKERHIHMKMLCEGRANHAGYPFLKKMKKAGFNVIYFGAESGSQRVLDYYNKRITPEKTAEAVANAKRAGMLVATSYILGAPIESREEMNETISFAESMRPHVVQYNILDMLIGTPLWDELIKEGKIGPDDWKTNHRVYDYFPEHASQEELETLVNEGYTGYINAWKNRKGIMELIHVLLLNKSARDVIFGNIVNPAARKIITDGMKDVLVSELDSCDLICITLYLRKFWKLSLYCELPPDHSKRPFDPAYAANVIKGITHRIIIIRSNKVTQSCCYSICQRDVRGYDGGCVGASKGYRWADRSG